MNIAKEYIDSFHCILDQMIQAMTSAELTDSISHNFIVQMIPHHMAAIENMREIEPICAHLRNSQRDLNRYKCRIDRILNTMFCGMKSASATMTYVPN